MAFPIINTNFKADMEPSSVYYDKAGFVTTKYGNKISKKSVLCGSDKICVRGKTIIESGAIIRGDLAVVNVGEYCLIAENTVIRPPEQKFKGQIVFINVKVGDNVIIEKDSIVEAASIGSYVHIGKGCIIGKRCILSDCCLIEDGTVLAPGTVVPPFTLFSGSPGMLQSKLPESFQIIMTDLTSNFYKHFLPKRE